ncbi:MAG: tannase/feruloyl esterase family alpha/beta hydrolase [Acidobacteria bacterium]|jgi:feruloyl esterase|nr:tannase/feruloyl esterase family alpha/beta hydrolase [Acidobacteriota bacterium]|tara:strand:- start:230 stop:1858 length:1629 start_codon:yes stop_codon:yes gene_type:complete
MSNMQSNRISQWMTLLWCATCAVALAMVAACGAGSAESTTAAEATDPMSCATLASLALPQTTITLAQAVPAGEFTPPGANRPIDVPAFCRVAATTEPAINFEVWLPAEGWNGKFHTAGNGGMAGVISYGAMVGALERGYATASTDTGHIRGDGGFDADWALDRPDLVEDFGHRSLHLTSVHGKAITEARYGAPPDYSYYVGCSKGGQQGMMEAQRYPEDFDGLVIGDPAHNWTSFYASAHLWYALSTLDDPDSYITPKKAAILGNAVTAACDAMDGIEDGVIDDPRKCAFDPDELTCAAGQDQDTCFTQKQVQAVKDIWRGPVNAAGDVIYPGLVPGGEAGPGGWSSWVTGREAYAGTHFLAAEDFMRNMVFNDPEWDFRTWDYERDLPIALAKTGPALDANNPDLRPLRDRGGKVLLYHGWSDADISPLGTIAYYEEVVKLLGEGKDSTTALAEVQEFFRLFMVPGMGHCRGGPGPDRFDALTALEQWVEDEVAPEQLVASKLEDGEVVRTRPLCPYPQVARWSGTGSTDDAANFACVLPD